VKATTEMFGDPSLHGRQLGALRDRRATIVCDVIAESPLAARRFCDPAPDVVCMKRPAVVFSCQMGCDEGVCSRSHNERVVGFWRLPSRKPDRQLHHEPPLTCARTVGSGGLG
jgi:hypothetical protein